MEKGVTWEFDDCLREAFHLPETEAGQYSPLVLAYLGDAIYDLVIRTLVVSRGNRQVHKLHKETSRLVQASAQSALMQHIQDLLTEEEAAVYRRGRNAKSVTAAKNQTVGDYRRATGFEALMGYLYLKRDWGRLTELVREGLSSLENES